jgi:uncharacterized repeat protein (TIGR01451 family)
MKRTTPSPIVSFIRLFTAGLAMLALVSVTLPHSAQAATSGGATIYNTVKVTYQSGSGPVQFATANVSVTVNTVGAAANVTSPAGQTVAAGGIANYSYTVKSTSNGPDTYSTSALTNTPTGVTAATASSVTASVSLWGGITAAASGAGIISVPFGTTTGLTAGTSIIQFGANQYTVATITPGSAASTNAGTGNLVAEVPTTLTLTPIGAAPPITAGLIAAGTQVGEAKTIAVSLTAGNPSVTGTDGQYSTTFQIAGAATPVGTTTSTAVITIVSSPKVTITKTANVANAAPGGTIIYTITVTNSHATASVSNVTVIDAVPAYTTYVANSTRLNGITVAGDGATSPLIAGILVDANGSRAPAAVASGTLGPLGVATVIFNVTVN